MLLRLIGFELFKGGFDESESIKSFVNADTKVVKKESWKEFKQIVDT